MVLDGLMRNHLDIGECVTSWEIESSGSCSIFGYVVCRIAVRKDGIGEVLLCFDDGDIGSIVIVNDRAEVLFGVCCEPFLLRYLIGEYV